MNRLVWLDYWKGFSWSNIKAFFKKNKNNMWSWISIGLLWLSGCLGDDGIEEPLSLMVSALPLVFLFWSLALTSLTLPKVMHMSPMTANEREEFVQKKWKLALLVPNVVNVVFVVIGFMLQKDALSLVFLGVHFVMMSFGAIFYSGRNTDIFEVGMDKAFPVYAIFCELVALVVHVVTMVMLVQDGMVERAWLGVFTGAILLLEIPLLIKLMTYKKKLIGRIANYEASYDVGSY